MAKYLLSIDQGTTGTTVMVIDEAIAIVSKVNCEFPQIYPQPGWVEHDPEAIWSSVTSAIEQALQKAAIDKSDIAGIGITNQRETTVVWDRKSSRPVHNAIVWQDRRTAEICAEMKADGREAMFREKTGLVLDPYFSGTKLRWLLDNVDGCRARSEKGELAFGTIDTYLIWRLTSGQAHVTETSNASRTLMLDIREQKWSEELLDALTIPRQLLPEVRSSSEVYGETRGVPGLPDGIPIAGAAGDQQAALFGQACFSPGEAKCTYGTGAFLLVNTGETAVTSESGVLTTIAWTLDGKTSYALEGSAFIAGAAVQWLRDGLEIIESAAQIEPLAQQVEDSGGVVFVPALVGLGAPHWRPEARGLITGLSRGSTRAHIARATLEGIALQIHDLARAMTKDSGLSLNSFKVDGGAAANNLLMQLQADILQVELVRPEVIETTALGAAFLAGLATSVWKSPDAIADAWKPAARFSPKMNADVREAMLARWSRALTIA